ncbi:hypothetical protein Q31a_31230 [Aureliella helgolandensis]|uniref:Uncharacterized protein n=1 Tax=Aureliella helgolandensis TaxID=2527968 RepID=A0A518G893_9BACT|nr:hypothetical protein Q31a_31230 [Aureliella helgolandensis]
MLVGKNIDANTQRWLRRDGVRPIVGAWSKFNRSGYDNARESLQEIVERWEWLLFVEQFAEAVWDRESPFASSTTGGINDPGTASH